MSDDRQAGTVVTSENLAEFHAQKLGLAVEDAPVLAEESPEEDSERAVEAESQSEPEAEKEAEVTDKPKQNPKIEKRFSELTKQRELAKQEAAKEREAREALEARLREIEQKVNPQPVDDPIGEEPQPNQFTDAFEYAKALSEWKVEKVLAERDRAEAERRANEERNKVIQSWTQKVEAAKAKLPDFEEMVASADVAVSDQIRDAIIESDVGPQVLYHLAENTDYARKLAEMPVAKALKELGKLEARFEVKDEPEAKSVARQSKAPSPIRPLKASSSAADVPINADGEFHGTYQQWREMRQARKIR
ncbi:bacteriophage [Caudoviricetes sp.]|nr:bacteriophage [Caudoviricetes sp.]